VVSIYYDWDGKFDQRPSQDKIDKMFTDFKADLEKLHPGRMDEFRFAARHGPLIDKKVRKYKISWRAWLPTVCAEAQEIPIYIRSVLGLGPKDVHDHIDLSIFKVREQLLGCIGGCKDIDVEKRYLVPIDGDGKQLPWEAIHPEEYLAQNPKEDATRLKVNHPAVVAKKPRGKREKASSAPSAETTSAGKTSFMSSDPNAKEVLASSSLFFGDRYHLHEELEMITVDRGKKCLLLPTKEKWCFLSRKKHASNNPYVVISEAGARLKCPDEDCKAKGDLPLIPVAELPKPVRDFFTQIFYGHVDDEIMTLAKDECKRNIVQNFPDEEGTETSPLDDMLTTIARNRECIQCKSRNMRFEHTLRGWNLRCIDCMSQWPSYPVPLPESVFPKLYSALTQLNVAIGSVGTIIVNNNNYLTADEPFVGTYDEDGLVVFEDGLRNAAFLRALQGTDATLSAFVFAVYREEFHCCKSGAKGLDGLWYQFRDHHWVPRAELTLRQLLGEDAFLKYFRRALQFYERECVQTEETTRKARNVKRICEQLGDGARRKRILDDAIERFHAYRPDFAENLDAANMLVFTNGVYDFNTFEFRDGRPEDCLSFALKVPYEPVDWDATDCKFVMEFMTAIQPDEDTRDYLLTVLSLCLTTDTSMQHFWILTGAGANGKSKLMNFLMQTLGEHYGTAPAALLTRRREDANQANEALSALEKTRIAVFSEGAASEVLQVNTIKLFTGEDAITTRGLHEKQRRWTPNFKTLMTCNAIPLLDDDSWAAWRRIKVIFFPTLFVDNPKRPHERKKDSDVGKKLSACTAAFLSILIEYFRRFKAAGLRESRAVTEATKKYQTDNDVLEEFRGEHLIEEANSTVVWTEVFAVFRNWAHGSGSKISTSRTNVKNLFEKKFGDAKKINLDSGQIYGWRGMRLM